MSRPREFDLDDAVSKATQAFLARGYEGTSMGDLTEAMGIEKGSLYKAFNDKRSLYLEGLRRYLAAGHDKFKLALGGHADAVDAIYAVLTAATTPCNAAQGATGCLAVSAMGELAPHDDEIRAMLDAHWARVGDLLTNTLSLGQRAGQVRNDRPAADLAALLVRLLSGIAVHARQRPCNDRCAQAESATRIRAVIDTAAALLRP
jgi:TetR/AcrR family transcriptional repressor of nem operon